MTNIIGITNYWPIGTGLAFGLIWLLREIYRETQRRHGLPERGTFMGVLWALMAITWSVTGTFSFFARRAAAFTYLTMAALYGGLGYLVWHFWDGITRVLFLFVGFGVYLFGLAGPMAAVITDYILDGVFIMSVGASAYNLFLAVLILTAGINLSWLFDLIQGVSARMARRRYNSRRGTDGAKAAKDLRRKH